MCKVVQIEVSASEYGRFICQAGRFISRFGSKIVSRSSIYIENHYIKYAKKFFGAIPEIYIL